MLRKILDALSGRQSEGAGGREGSFHRLGWVGADRSPFGVRMLDCRSVTRTLAANSDEPRIARSFLSLRGSTGDEHRGASPENPKTVSCRLLFPAPDSSQEGPVFRAKVMEEKWDVFRFEADWYLCQSWTGKLIFKVSTESGADGLCATGLEYDSGQLDGDDTLALGQADFLLKNLVFGWKGPHPLPGGFPEDIKKIAQYSFDLYGRRASFASYEDTTALRPE